MKGTAAVKAFLAEHGADELPDSKEPRFVAMRAALIRRLKADGLNNCEIARVLKIDRTTVGYWLCDVARATKKRRLQTARDEARA
jgi:DNA invertase Pin-like site-specific DNA recombinase